jgi:hypothetical protein
VILASLAFLAALSGTTGLVIGYKLGRRRHPDWHKIARHDQAMALLRDLVAVDDVSDPNIPVLGDLRPRANTILEDHTRSTQADRK